MSGQFGLRKGAPVQRELGEVVYWYNGVDYLKKMETDTDFFYKSKLIHMGMRGKGDAFA